MGRLLKKNKKLASSKPKSNVEKEKWEHIIASKPWKNTEKMLKRNFTLFFPAIKYGPSMKYEDISLDFEHVIRPEHVRELYILHLAAAGVRVNKEMSVELCRLSGTFTENTRISMKYIICPSLIRMKNTGFSTQPKKKMRAGFRRGLLFNLMINYDPEIVRKMIEGLPFTKKEIGLASEFHLIAWYNVSSFFQLLMLELLRLDYQQEYQQLCKILYLFDASPVLINNLAIALFFTLIASDIKYDLKFESFFERDHNLRDAKSSVRQKNIREFIDTINKEYLFPAKIRAKLKLKKIESIKKLSDQNKKLALRRKLKNPHMK
ncbi:Uncharacterised protein [Serratia fonticola]|uniref:hypothetical protein n=1 Tax=Serratia fonticola TaxID=47917 RepID=UPI0021841D45|nr:hypothetical protein [Serratia fonticola]CAI2140936.1 Uncharacterised protein [Serratia fonticola]